MLLKLYIHCLCIIKRQVADLLNSLFLAFAMYSKIPVPKAEWSERSMRYSLCFFPLVGVILGTVFLAVYMISEKLGFGMALRGALLTAVPVFVTGGIHADGFIDTVDAYSSFCETEKRLEILKDPHVGAFGIVHTVIYFVLWFGFSCEIGRKELPFVCFGFVMSRVLSGIGALTLKAANRHGTLFTIAENSEKRNCIFLLAAFYLALTFFLIVFDTFLTLVVVVVSICSFAYYKNFSSKNFGGVTGDLAGYFLQICELSILVCVVVMCRVGA